MEIKKVLITGSEGFVGSATKQYFEDKKIEVVGYDIMNSKDIRNYDQLFRMVSYERPDRILHLAAISRFADADQNPKLAYETNVIGTENVARVAKEFQIPVVYSSTGSVYMPISQEPPITEDFKAMGNSVYGCSKYLGELYLQEHASPWMILRYSHLYGQEKKMHGLIGGYLSRLNRALAPTLYGGKQSNDFCYIKDIVEANYKAVTARWEAWNQIYNIGTGEELSAEAAGQTLIEEYNKRFPRRAFKGEVNRVEQRTVDPSRFVFDTTKAETRLGFQAKYSFQEGLRDMLKDGV